MLECKAAMVSYTQANRARQALQQHGISSEIRRLEHLGPEAAVLFWRQEQTAAVSPHFCPEREFRFGVPWKDVICGDGEL